MNKIETGSFLIVPVSSQLEGVGTSELAERISIKCVKFYERREAVALTA